MDISGIKPVERTVEIKHPVSGEELGITVGLISYDDPAMKRIRRQILNRRLHLEARGKHFKAEEIEDNSNELCFAAMTSWNWQGEANFQGKKPDFNKVAVFAVFDELKWFRDQIDEAIGDEKAFFTASK